MRDPDLCEAQPAGAEKTITLLQWAVICLAVYLVRLYLWADAELWHDEVITLGDFAIGPPDRGIAHVFRSYPVANNHILFSAVAYWWVRFTGFSLAEYLLRLPSILCGAATIVLLPVLWRRWLDRRVALLVALTFAISPVFTAFAYQFRGYALTMLLTLLAAAGVAEVTSGRLAKGLRLQLPAMVLLPLVMPSNVLLAFSHALFIVLWRGSGVSALRRLVAGTAVGAAGLLGLSYYLTLWDQFAEVMRQSTGWGSGWQVLGNVLLGMTAHLGLLAPAALAALVLRDRSAPSQAPQDRGWSLLYAACLFLPIAGSALLRGGDAPFPRVYLVYLVPFSLAAARLASAGRDWAKRPFMLLVGLTLVVGYGIEMASSALTQRALQEGKHPQNLLQQYYRGSDDLRKLAAFFADPERRGVSDIMVTNAYDFPTFRFYWARQGFPAEAVTAENREPRAVWGRAKAFRGSRLFAIAVNEREAARLFAAAGESGHFDLVAHAGITRCYMLLPRLP